MLQIDEEFVPLTSGIGNLEHENTRLTTPTRGMAASRRKPDDIAAQLSAKFAAPTGEIRVDVLGLAAEMLERRMITDVE
jgi:hypothetical protein